MEEDGSHYIGPPHGHIPVLVEEVLAGLHCRPGGVYVDCTIGQGGLAARILDAAGPGGMLIGIDRDEEALAMTRERLKQFPTQLRLVHGNFGDIKHHVRTLGLSCVDGIVFDLGVSSVQLNDANRGFSFMAEGPLDMRMDRSGETTAAQLLARLSEAELSNIIFQYGEERYARRIARSIARARELRPLRTTAELVSVIRSAVPGSYRHGRIHFATRTFQALRIAVNGELDRSGETTAAQLLARLSEAELSNIIFQYGEERYARRIARSIARARELRPLRTTAELVSVIRSAVPGSYRHGRIHFATRTFQALRIAVNGELDVLAAAFQDAAEMLSPGGRLCIISFHSLEDRIAKHTIRELSQGPEPVLLTKTKRPVVALESEVAGNPRSRSAKLRIAERLPQRRCA